MDRQLRRLALWNWRLTAAAVGTGAGLLAVFWKNLPPEVPLLYSRPWGQDQLVSPYFLWGLPVLAASVGTSIAALASAAHQERLLAALMLATSLVVQTIILLAVVRIVTLVA